MVDQTQAHIHLYGHSVALQSWIRLCVEVAALAPDKQLHRTDSHKDPNSSDKREDSCLDRRSRHNRKNRFVRILQRCRDKLGLGDRMLEEVAPGCCRQVVADARKVEFDVDQERSC
jgi:hypothetical protein